MESFSALLAFCTGNSLVNGEFPPQRQAKRNFDIFFDLRLNKRVSTQSWGWGFETPSRSLWRHRNIQFYCNKPGQQCRIDIYNFGGWQAGPTVSSVCAPEVYGLLYVCIPSTYNSLAHQLYECVNTTDLRSSVDLLPGLMNNLQNHVELWYKSLPEQCIQEFPWELFVMTTSSYQASLPG